jgi:hypothetical protein
MMQGLDLSNGGSSCQHTNSKNLMVHSIILDTSHMQGDDEGCLDKAEMIVSALRARILVIFVFSSSQHETAMRHEIK